MEYIIARTRRLRRRAAERQRRHETLAHHRSLRDETDPFADPRFQSIYKLTPDMARSLVNEIRPHFPGTQTCAAIPTELKVLAALHFYGHGSYQKAEARDSGTSMSQASISRAITETTMALNTPQVLRKWIQFPSDADERHQIVLKNYRDFGVPGVLGYVDGTHVLLRKPNIHDDLYINGNGQHSLNVQILCDCELLILNILAKYPGGTEDAIVWGSSLLREKMAQLSEKSCWLLGDSAYPLEPWILTPILDAKPNSPDAKYTELHKRSHNCAKRCIRVLKARFKCLHERRVLEYTPTKVGCITNACAVLHNMCVRARLPEPEEIDLDDPPPTMPCMNGEDDQGFYKMGLHVRTELINRLF